MTSVILQSDVLRDALLELDYAGATVAELHLSPEMPKLKFQSTSVTGASCMVQFPDPELSTQIFTSFRSRKQQVCFAFPTFADNPPRQCKDLTCRFIYCLVCSAG